MYTTICRCYHIICLSIVPPLTPTKVRGYIAGIQLGMVETSNFDFPIGTVNVSRFPWKPNDLHSSSRLVPSDTGNYTAVHVSWNGNWCSSLLRTMEATNFEMFVFQNGTQCQLYTYQAKITNSSVFPELVGGLLRHQTRFTDDGW